VRVALQDPQWRVVLCEEPQQGLEIVARQRVDVAISDVRMPGLDGFEFLDRVLEIDPSVEVIFLTGFSTVADAVESLRRGATDYLTKPFRPADLSDTVRAVLERRRCPAAEDSRFEKAVEPIVGRDSTLREVLSLAREFSLYQVPVLIHGETGTGKELVARAIHDGGPRAEGPYVVCNCSAFSDTLFESEFFGHARGAFTDADEARPGLFEVAQGGVLFLDEIGDLSLASQAKLLRALERGEIQRVGETEIRRFDVQVVAATNKDLAEEVRLGRFRKDLYYRLDVARIALPPLRERRQDIPQLVEKFLAEAAREFGRPKPGVEPATLDALVRYSWPGNVRELRNVVHRLLLFHGEGDIAPVELPLEIAACAGPGTEVRETSIDAVRREHIERVLRQLKGNKSDAARILGVSRVTLYREIQRYGLQV
jgi:DNA-binding NtrC family response regulator